MKSVLQRKEEEKASTMKAKETGKEERRRKM